jgi:hypothetical protein
MIRIIATAVCVLLTLSLTGQRQRKQTVVLYDGSRISGTIVGDSSDYLNIKVMTPQIIRIGKSQISSLEASAYPVKKNLKTEGYYIQLSASVLTGKDSTGFLSGNSFHFSNGYQFRNGIVVGIGTGLEKMNVTIVPLYADFRYYPLSTRISPYAWIKSGYGFATTDIPYTNYNEPWGESEGGFLFGAGAGIALFTWQRAAINIGIGYRYQKISLSHDEYWWGGNSVRETVTQFNRLELQVGFMFR